EHRPQPASVFVTRFAPTSGSRAIISRGTHGAIRARGERRGADDFCQSRKSQAPAPLAEGSGSHSVCPRRAGRLCAATDRLVSTAARTAQASFAGIQRENPRGRCLVVVVGTR